MLDAEDATEILVSSEHNIQHHALTYILPKDSSELAAFVKLMCLGMCSPMQISKEQCNSVVTCSNTLERAVSIEVVSEIF